MSVAAVEEIAAASIANVVKKANVVAPLNHDDGADVRVVNGDADDGDDDTHVSAFENDAYVHDVNDDAAINGDVDDDVEEDDSISTSSMSKSRSESFSTDTYKKSKSKRLPPSQHQPSFLQRLVETAKVSPAASSTASPSMSTTMPKSETVAANLGGGGGGGEADCDLESSSSRPPAVMRSLSASPTFTVKKEKNEINEEVILDRIRNLAEEEKDDDDEGGTKKANSLPTSPTPHSSYPRG